MAQRKKSKKTSFVPRIVFTTAMLGAGVIPLCASACGGNISRQGQQVPDVGPGVAADAFNGVADTGFKGGVADTGFNGVADTGFSVADVGFDAVAADAFGVLTDAFGVADTGFGGVAMTGFEGGDAPFGVADTGFHGGDGGEPTDGGEG